MSGLIAIYACVAVSALALAAIAIAAPRRLAPRVGALAAAALLLGSGYFGLADLLSRPKPVRLAWAERAAQDAVVLASAYAEGKAIYLWLKLPNDDEPRAYSLPWSTAEAESLDQAKREATTNGRAGFVRVRQPFGEAGSGDQVEQLMFYAPAQPAPPPKSGSSSSRPSATNLRDSAIGY